MVRQTIDDQDFVDSLEEQLAQRQIVTDLMAMRAGARLSQEEIAERLKCTQSRVSKLESSSDGDLRLGDLASYADALGFKTRILLTPKDWTTADEVKYHAFCVKEHLDYLASLAERDPSIAQGVAGFLHEARVNFGLIVKSSAKTVLAALRAFGKQVPPCPTGSSLIRIEKREPIAEEDCGKDSALSGCAGSCSP
jgi:transcriptional regulator with XRE-family HTH domain